MRRAIREMKWRKYEGGDEFSVNVLRVQQEQMLSRSMGKEVTLDNPDLLKHPVLAAEVATDESGKVTGGFYLEACPCVCFFGTDPKVTSATTDRAVEVLQKLKECGFRVVLVEIPHCVPDKARRSMMKAAERAGKKSGIPFVDLNGASRGFFDLRDAQ